MSDMKPKRKQRVRSRRGAGTIIERKTRTMGVRYVIMHSYVDLEGRRHRPELRFATRSQAENASEVLKSKTAGRGKLGGNGMALTLLQVAQQWMHGSNVERSTEWTREMSLKNHILPYLGRHKMLEMGPDLIERWKNLLADAGVGGAARRMAWKHLRVCLQYAVDLRYLPTHPMHGLKPPPYQAKEIVPFSPEELERIFAACAGQRWQPLLQLTYWLALRQGEVLGLRWEDLDIAGRTLRICRKSVDEAGQQVVKDKTKTKAGMRTLHVGEEVLAIFEARRLMAEDEGLWPLGYQGELRPRPDTMTVHGKERETLDCEWVFPVTRGVRKPLDRKNLRRLWVPLLKSLGIAHRGIHHFRHTAATQMMLANENLPDIAGTLGHAKPDTSLRLYGHIIRKTHGGPLASLSLSGSLENQRQAAERRLDTPSQPATVPPAPCDSPDVSSVGVTGIEPVTPSV